MSGDLFSTGNVVQGEARQAAMPFSMMDFEAEAHALLQNARSEAERIRDESTQQAEALRTRAQAEGRTSGHDKGCAEGLEAGRKEGYEAGYKEGLKQGAEDGSMLSQALDELVNKFTAEKDRLVERARVDLMRLALAVARRIVRREIDLDPDIAQRAVQEAIDLVANRTDVVVRLHADDLNTLEHFRRSLVQQASGAADGERPAGDRVRLVADESVARGGCVLTTTDGEVDMQVESQLASLERFLAGETREEEEPGK